MDSLGVNHSSQETDEPDHRQVAYEAGFERYEYGAVITGWMNEKRAPILRRRRFFQSAAGRFRALSSRRLGDGIRVLHVLLPSSSFFRKPRRCDRLSRGTPCIWSSCHCSTAVALPNQMFTLHQIEQAAYILNNIQGAIFRVQVFHQVIPIDISIQTIRNNHSKVWVNRDLYPKRPSGLVCSCSCNVFDDTPSSSSSKENEGFFMLFA